MQIDHKNITTTLPLSVIRMIDENAKKFKKNKNEIISESVIYWNKKNIQKEIQDSYRNAQQDPEWVELSNIIIDDRYAI